MRLKLEFLSKKAARPRPPRGEEDGDLEAARAATRTSVSEGDDRLGRCLNPTIERNGMVDDEVELRHCRSHLAMRVSHEYSRLVQRPEVCPWAQIARGSQFFHEHDGDDRPSDWSPFHFECVFGRF